jgi:hypothetical protein
MGMVTGTMVLLPQMGITFIRHIIMYTTDHIITTAPTHMTLSVQLLILVQILIILLLQLFDHQRTPIILLTLMEMEYVQILPVHSVINGSSTMSRVVMNGNVVGECGVDMELLICT